MHGARRRHNDAARGRPARDRSRVGRRGLSGEGLETRGQRGWPGAGAGWTAPGAGCGRGWAPGLRAPRRAAVAGRRFAKDCPRPFDYAAGGRRGSTEAARIVRRRNESTAQPLIIPAR